jgi:hypothetical protein
MPLFIYIVLCFDKFVILQLFLLYTLDYFYISGGFFFFCLYDLEVNKEHEYVHKLRSSGMIFGTYILVNYSSLAWN